MKICIIFGTRPEIIKLSSTIKELESRGIDFVLIHTNQHYSKNLDEIFFDCLKLPKPKHNLNVGSGTHGQVTGRMLISIEEKLIEEKPDFVLVQGDTNSVLAGALAAVKLNIPVGHIEAGLRSFDTQMPEETNRVMVDHISSLLFAPTVDAINNLKNEGISEDKILLSGNTVVDALIDHSKISETSDILKRVNLKSGEYILSTIHRQENVDNESRLRSIFVGLEKVSEFTKLPILLPGHPRLIKMIDQFKIKPCEKIIIIEPVDYLDFIQLEKNSKIIMTDSGGIQEEACILKVPCVTLRDNTERPETIEVGANILAGADSEKILSSVKTMIDFNKIWENPFGVGDASRKIIDAILDKLK
ncbi:MAG: UDP-N-acetylglucosamine 2-epimerase (non-hydrolyzing) [Candidatus Paceibacterota bacterium]